MLYLTDSTHVVKSTHYIKHEYKNKEFFPKYVKTSILKSSGDVLLYLLIFCYPGKPF